MSFIYYLLLTAVFCITPAGVIYLCRKFPVLEKIGPIMILYAIGLVIGNIPHIPDQIKVLQDIIPSVVVPFAIPMMLFCCRFSSKDTILQIKVVISGFISVCIAVISGYLLFGRHINFGAQIGGIISGMYTGGTINAAALQAIFKLDSEVYMLVNSYDIIISFLYFIFLFSVGIGLFRRLYGQRENSSLSKSERAEIDKSIEEAKESSYSRIFTKAGAIESLKIFTIALVIVALSAGIALLLPQNWFMVVFILLLTTIGVITSFIKRVRALTLSYDIGMYLIYIFSITIASMADFSHLDISQGLYQIAFMSFAVFFSLFLHATICRLLRVDADSMVISSVAFINSPPFVPMAAAVMGNKQALITGLTAGIVGYAIGNHFGYIMAELLSRL